MSFFIPNGYLTIDQAIDRVVELNQGDAGPLLTEDEKATLRDFRAAMRPQPKAVVPVAKADGRNWFTSSKTPTDQTPDTSVEDKPLPNVTLEEVRDLRKKEAQLKEQQSAAGEELRQRLFAGQLPSETITQEGSLIETPISIWGGDQWHEVFKSGVIKWFERGLGVAVSGQPLIPRDVLKAAFKPDRTVGTIATETKCQNWLVSLMNAGGPTKPKADYLADAKKKFSIGDRAFHRAWSQAIDATGKTEWRKPGRKS